MGKTVGPVPVTVLNTGTKTTSVLDAYSTTPNFSVSGLERCRSIQVGGSCELLASFTPRAAGSWQARIRMVAGAGERFVDMSGVATPPPPPPPPPPPAKVAAKATTTLGIAADRATVVHGKAVTFKVTLKPATKGRTVALQRWLNGKWTTVARATVDRYGRVSFTVKPPKKGTYTYRAACAASSTHNAATSTKKTIKAT